MSWECPECGKKLKRKSSADGHMATFHDQPEDAEINESMEQYITGGNRQLTGEIGRLRALRQRDPQRWDPVYHTHVKVSGVADTKKEREELRLKVNRDRLTGRW